MPTPGRWGWKVSTGRSLSDGIEPPHLDEPGEVALERATRDVPVQLRDLLDPEPLGMDLKLGL